MADERHSRMLVALKVHREHMEKQMGPKKGAKLRELLPSSSLKVLSKKASKKLALARSTGTDRSVMAVLHGERPRRDQCVVLIYALPVEKEPAVAWMGEHRGGVLNFLDAMHRQVLAEPHMKDCGTFVVLFVLPPDDDGEMPCSLTSAIMPLPNGTHGLTALPGELLSSKEWEMLRS